jgi:poly(3-hydroxybutyrate) depolymerase
MRIALCISLALLAGASCRSGSPAVVDKDVVTEPPRDTASGGDAPATTDAPPSSEDVRYTGGFGAVSGVYTLTIGGRARTVRVHVPPGDAAARPLMVAFHGTNGAAEDFENETRIDAISDELGFVVAVPQGEDLQGDPANADHQSRDLYARMWDIVDRNPATNRDLLLTRAVIQEGVRALRVDARRVYLVGHSNGGFFAYHAAATMPSRVAAFASSCAGVIRCGYRSECGFAAGVGTTCAALRGESGFCAQTCAASTSRMAPLPTGRMPRGFLAHGNRDDMVSVSFTCALSREMGDRAEVQIVDGLTHALAPDFVRGAWSRLSRYTVSD